MKKSYFSLLEHLIGIYNFLLKFLNKFSSHLGKINRINFLKINSKNWFSFSFGGQVRGSRRNLQQKDHWLLPKGWRRERGKHDVSHHSWQSLSFHNKKYRNAKNKLTIYFILLLNTNLCLHTKVCQQLLIPDFEKSTYLLENRFNFIISGGKYLVI